MSKKKLAFYDAFRQKPDEAEQPSDSVPSDSSTSSKNISGYVAYTPGEELTIRPRPKHIPTSHHSVGGQNIEVRAKGSSLPPGMAQKYQTPNVNRTYLPSDGSVSGTSRPIPSINPVSPAQRNTPPMPPIPSEEPQTSNVELQPFESVKVAPSKPTVTIPKRTEYHAVPDNSSNVKPVSDQSQTMPYLDVEDLETQNIQIPAPKKIPSSKPQAPVVNTPAEPNLDGVLLIPIPMAFMAIPICLGLMAISYYIGSSFQSENKQTPKMEVPAKVVESEITQPIAPEHKKIDEPIKVEVNTPPKDTVIDIPRKGIIIRACTVESLDKAKSLAQKLESSGIKPTELKQTKRGVLISVGPFETSAEANTMLKSLKFKSINGWKPFEDAYIMNNR